MTDHERWTAFCAKRTDAPMCANCRHYCRHYIRNLEHSDQFTPLDEGHCTYPRIKDRLPFDVCKYYEEGGDPT